MKSPYKGKFKVTQVFKGTPHRGIDLVGLDDKTIYSTVNGVVEASRYDTHPTGGMGLYVRVRENVTNRRYYFAHLSEVFVREGQRVKVGDKIGTEGSTGHSTGSHLHYEVRIEPNNATFLDVSEISGIPNELGTYEVTKMTVPVAKKIVQDKTGLDDRTIQYIADDYRYGDRLIVVLAEAMS